MLNLILLISFSVNWVSIEICFLNSIGLRLSIAFEAVGQELVNTWRKPVYYLFCCIVIQHTSRPPYTLPLLPRNSFHYLTDPGTSQKWLKTMIEWLVSPEYFLFCNFLCIYEAIDDKNAWSVGDGLFNYGKIWEFMKWG